MRQDRLATIIIVAKNELRHLRRSLPAVLNQEVNVDIEVIVIDSGSTDGSVEFVETIAGRDSRLSLVRIAPHEFHHAKTRNLGVRLANGRFVVFLGGDAIPLDRQWLKELLLPLEDTARGVIATYGRQLPRPDTNTCNRCRITYIYGENAVLKYKYAPLSTKEKYSFSTVSCAIDASRIEGALFDEDLPVNEDVGFSFRQLNRGWRIAYCPLSRVEHAHNYSNVEILRRYFDNVYTYNRLGILATEQSTMAGDARHFLKHALVQLRGSGAVAYFQFALFFFCAAMGVALARSSKLIPSALLARVTKYGV